MANKITVITSIINHIEEHLTKKLDLDEIAKAVHYSKYYLHRTFTEIVGITIHDYIQRRQLTEAAKLLVFSEESIISISLLAGYESQQAFTKIFKEMYKVTPNQFREREEFYPLQLEYKFESHKDNIIIKSNHIREIYFATKDDILDWMALVHLTIDGFPNLQEKEHQQTLKQYIANKGALIMREDGHAIGTMMISHLTGSIDFLGVHPLYKKQGITKQFLEKALEILASQKQIKTTTFRAGDKADTGYRKALKELGFAESILLTEFGYPTQEMILPKEKNYEEE